MGIDLRIENAVKGRLAMIIGSTLIAIGVYLLMIHREFIGFPGYIWMIPGVLLLLYGIYDVVNPPKEEKFKHAQRLFDDLELGKKGDALTMTDQFNTTILIPDPVIQSRFQKLAEVLERKLKDM